MKVYICPESSELGKFMGIISAFPNIWRGTLLDVGCRSAKFKEALIRCEYKIKYYGLDVVAPADIIANLEKGLPFNQRSFDIVLALDVLEHTDDIYRAFKELCIVSRKYVVITLPNVYCLEGRIKFMLGKPISGKYGLPIYPPNDRHRWIFSLNEARKFVKYYASEYGFVIKKEGCLVGPRRGRRLRYFVQTWPNLFCPTFLCLLARREY